MCQYEYKCTVHKYYRSHCPNSEERCDVAECFRDTKHLDELEEIVKIYEGLEKLKWKKHQK